MMILWEKSPFIFINPEDFKVKKRVFYLKRISEISIVEFKLGSPKKLFFISKMLQKD